MYYGIFVYVAEQGDFLAKVQAQFMFGTQHQNVRLDTGTLQFLDRVLGRLGLQLAGGCQIGYISQVYTQGVFAQFPLQLSDTFQIRQRLDIAHGSADFCNDEVEFIFVAQQFHVTFDFVRDVRDDLDRFA